MYSLGERKGVYWVPGLLVVWLIILRNAPQRWLSPERRKQRFLVSSVHSLIASYDHFCLRPSYRHWEHRSELGRPKGVWLASELEAPRTAEKNTAEKPGHRGGVGRANTLLIHLCNAEQLSPEDIAWTAADRQ